MKLSAFNYSFTFFFQRKKCEINRALTEPYKDNNTTFLELSKSANLWHDTSRSISPSRRDAPYHPKIYEDKPPYKEVQRIEIQLEELYEHVIFVKQLLQEPRIDTFAVAMFFMNVNEGETSNIITFKRENESWLEPIENV